MSALEPGVVMNPAPTLLSEWLTPTGFGIIVAILLIVAVIVTVAENIRDRRENGQPASEQVPPVYDDLCAIQFCNRYASTQFPGSKGALLVCRYHAGWVSEWTGPAIFDQEDGVA